MSTNLTINCTSADADGFTAEASWPLNQPVNTVALRTLIMNMAAIRRGITLKALWEEGYDRNLKEGWTVTAGPAASGRKTYTARPLTARETAQKLHDEGGTTKNGDGSLSFWLPGEYPAPKTVPVRVKRQR